MREISSLVAGSSPTRDYGRETDLLGGKTAPKRVKKMSKPIYRERVGLSAEVEALESIALKFAEAINAADPEGLTNLQIEDFTFIDMSGNVTRGRQGWQDYFTGYPNCNTHVRHVLAGGKGVAIIGKTTGSHVPREVEVRETILWTAEIRDDLVAEWRIYADLEEAKRRAEEAHQGQ